MKKKKFGIVAVVLMVLLALVPIAYSMPSGVKPVSAHADNSPISRETDLDEIYAVLELHQDDILEIDRRGNVDGTYDFDVQIENKGDELTEAVTCEWVNGYQDHGPKVTQFDIDQTVYAYVEIHGSDLYGKTVKHEWWYNGEKKWEWSKTCSNHYTGWGSWTWWAIGQAYGLGTGYIKVFLDGVYMGKTNDYTVVEEDEYGNLDVEYPSGGYVGTGKPGWIFNGEFKVKNVGSAGSELDWRVSDYPSWGIWTFSPSSGINLKPEDGKVLVDFSFSAPGSMGRYEGDIKVENKNNPGDYVKMHVICMVLDFCCFPAGTKITMADGCYKNIEDVKIGDLVKSFNEDTQQFENNKVLELETPIREGYYNLYFGSNQRVKVTNEHPFYTKKLDGSIVWCSLEPERTHEYYPYLYFVQQLEIGDTIYTDEGTWTEIYGWEYAEGSIQTYNLGHVENTNTFFADSLLVHNKCCFTAGTKIRMADGTTKNVEDVRTGNQILSYDVDKGKFISWRVLCRPSPYEQVFQINNGLINTTTPHPFYIKKPDGRTGWGAMDPESAFKWCNLPEKLLTLEIGDMLFTVNEEWIEIKSIDYLGKTRTYTIDSILGIQPFFANDLLVYQEHRRIIPPMFYGLFHRLIYR
ncbi:MAG: hypothetical protein KAW45_05460 [Thermoplasmatales archaeon]|nr:hypothetical protein [Thermoplasmatales archaeon]